MIEQDVLDRIQQLLTFKHSSLYKLAKQSDIPYSSLNNIFNRQTCPTMVTLEKICHGFNISLSEFFSFESNPLRNELLSDDEEELLNTYKELSVQNKKLLKAYLDVAKSAVASTSDVRMDMVNDVKARIQAGTYNISSEDVADKILDRISTLTF